MDFKIQYKKFIVVLVYVILVFRNYGNDSFNKMLKMLFLRELEIVIFFIFRVVKDGENCMYFYFVIF